MSRTMALILVNVVMMVSVVAAALVIRANDEVFMLIVLLIAAGTGFAVSEVVGHYADRDDERPRPPAA